MKSPFLALAAFCAMLAVCLGAFGAHGLKHIISPEMLAVYKTGVTYHMWHALGLAFIAHYHAQQKSTLLNFAGWLMFCGIILFSGSLYLLALLSIRWLGMITPFGGLCFIAAWLLFGIFAIKQAKTPDQSH